MRATTAATEAKAATVFIWILLPAALLAAVVAISSLPHNIVNDGMPYRLRTTMTAFAPEGWAFFTRDAEEYTFQAWRSDAADANEHLVHRSSVIEVNRSDRINGAILMSAGETVPDDSWTPCATIDLCVGAHNIKKETAPFKPEDGALCHEFTLVRVRPIPWAFRNQVDTSQLWAVRMALPC